MSLVGLIRSFLRRFPDDPAALQVAENVARRKADRSLADGHILVQAVEDPYYVGLFGHVAAALQARTGWRIDLNVPRAINAAIGTTLGSHLLRMFPLGTLLERQWLRIYARFADRVGHRSLPVGNPLRALADAVRAWRLWHSVRTARELETLSIDGIRIGDLIIDTYLRFRPSPRMEIRDPFLLYVLWHALVQLRRTTLYLRDARPRLYLASFTSYIPHGIPVRTALREGVPVFAFGNFQEFAKRLSIDDPHHTRNGAAYRRDFERLDRQEERLAEAERELLVRLRGGVDSATAYMTKSAYSPAVETELPDMQGAVVIFLHDFYDSPHIYGDLVFPDFWEWITFTIDVLQAQGTRFFVKPHPNQIKLGETVLDELRARYPSLQWVPQGATNTQLVDAGIVCAITVYGTVAHEVAYLGVPSIACAQNPHIAFDFCRTARDLETYAELLRTATTFRPDPAMLRTQALQFYAMHNLALPLEARRLRDAMTAAFRVCHDPGASPTDAIDAFEKMTALPGFAEFIETACGAA